MYTEARIQGIVPETVYLYFHIGGCVVVFVYLNIDTELEDVTDMTDISV